MLHGDDQPPLIVRAGIQVHIDKELCSECGACFDVCRFGAISLASTGAPTIASLACEGCNACQLVCPMGAIRHTPRVAGAMWFRETPAGPLAHAELSAGQESSGHLVAQLRDKAQCLVEAFPADWMIIDGPPGLGCPVQSTLVGVDEVLVVTEPTPAAKADLERLFCLLDQLGLSASVVVNKWDLAAAEWPSLVDVCEAWHVPIAGKIPYHEDAPRCIARGQLPLKSIPVIFEAYLELAQWLSHPTTPGDQRTLRAAMVPTPPSAERIGT